MCVLNGSQVHWTSEVEDAIEENKTAGNGLQKYLDYLNNQLGEMVDLVRQKITK